MSRTLRTAGTFLLFMIDDNVSTKQNIFVLKNVNDIQAKAVCEILLNIVHGQLKRYSFLRKKIASIAISFFNH